MEVRRAAIRTNRRGLSGGGARFPFLVTLKCDATTWSGRRALRDGGNGCVQFGRHRFFRGLARFGPPHQRYGCGVDVPYARARIGFVFRDADAAAGMLSACANGRCGSLSASQRSSRAVESGSRGAAVSRRRDTVASDLHDVHGAAGSRHLSADGARHQSADAHTVHDADTAAVAFARDACRLDPSAGSRSAFGDALKRLAIVDFQ